MNLIWIRIVFSSFKSAMFKYYIFSLYLCYDVDDPRIEPLHWRHKSLECPPDAP